MYNQSVEVAPQVYSVSQFLDLVNLQLEAFPAAIQGEITSLSTRSHAYFTLTDGQSKEPAVLNCALWQSRLRTLPFELKEGIEVQVLGHASVYKPSGRFSFIVEHISPVGEGALQKAFEQLKRQLEAKGFFAPERKRALPIFLTRIGLLTSESGEALRDFRQHLGQFGFQIVHRDIRVEGLNAIPSVVKGIEWFNTHPDALDGGVEVLVLTRGGGSLESLQAFNSVEVAEAIFASKIPVIAAIGHERDVTIADLVADVRASTPTDAGRILSENWRLAGDKMQYFARQIKQNFQQVLDGARDQLRQTWERVIHRFTHQLTLRQQRFAFLSNQVMAASPLNRLKQGYSIVTNRAGTVIKDKKMVQKDEALTITLSKGMVTAKVE
ncbi:MAG: Exodeoxyribonuclease 7 large subunit [Candidatus Pacebacteria bacterium GW2011_GWB1_47_8]|nr:MAG: Exodeoxyribonuclease 7 large subunit [Candidatus Pacebacteria bacterium GW2011_GWA1_46_10]KKU84282.1 MAG: Exodeoxyribonuclease 7 large subunit [Candidatus Pacebacteria bacterium GW2011_GWB1_47_8]